MKYFCMAIMIAWVPLALFSQGRSVVFDLEKGWFDNGQALPSGTRWILNGEAEAGVQLVQVEIFKNAKAKGKAIYQNQWRSQDADVHFFSVPIQYSLQSNSAYAIRISMHRKLEDSEKESLHGRILNHSMAYLSNMLEMSKRKITLRSNATQVISGLEEIARMHLATLEFQEVRYSEMLKKSIRDLHQCKLRKAEYRMAGKVESGTGELRKAYFEALLKGIRDQIATELEIRLNGQVLAQSQVFLVKDYPTEKVPSALNIDLGYAGIYNSGSLSQVSYAAAPYAGLSFPLWRTRSNDLSISTGVFLTNLDFQDGQGSISGPVVGRPLYVGVGYRLLRIVRLSAGAVALQASKSGSTVSLNSIYLRPFLGAGIALNVSAGHRR